MIDTLWCHYNTANFLQNTHMRFITATLTFLSAIPSRRASHLLLTSVMGSFTVLACSVGLSLVSSWTCWFRDSMSKCLGCTTSLNTRKVSSCCLTASVSAAMGPMEFSSCSFDCSQVRISCKEEKEVKRILNQNNCLENMARKLTMAAETDGSVQEICNSSVSSVLAMELSFLH